MPQDFRAFCEAAAQENPWSQLEGGLIEQMMAIIEACESEEQARACLTSREIQCLMARLRGDAQEEA